MKPFSKTLQKDFIQSGTPFLLCIFLVLSSVSSALGEADHWTLPGTFINFGSDLDGLADFQLMKVAAPDADPRGSWQVQAEAINFSLSHSEPGSTYMEIGVLRDLTELGWSTGEDFTFSMEAEVSGIQSAWNRFGIIALSEAPDEHTYGGSNFYHAKVRVRPGSSNPPRDIHIAHGFGGEPFSNIDVEEVPVFGDGIFSMTLKGRYQPNGDLHLHFSVQHSEFHGKWVYEGIVQDPLDGSWFGVGGRIRTYANFDPSLNIRSVSLSRDLQVIPGMPIWVDENEPAPVLRAAEDLQRDLLNRFQVTSPIVHDPEVLSDQSCIVILGQDSVLGTPSRGISGSEAHRITVEEFQGQRHLVAQGGDMRGKIFAIYTVSEEILGVPPLWIWSIWQASDNSTIWVPGSTDIHYPTPHVRWRALFPNDIDYYQPWAWQPMSATAPIDNRDALLETTLRMKLNAIDVGSIVNNTSDGITNDAQRAADRGLVVLSTHTAGLGTRLEAGRWNSYWNDIRELPSPEISIDNEDALFEFWQHAIDVIVDSGIETIWTVTFRGHGDVPFWENMTDAPETDAERAGIIDHIIRGQIDLLDNTIEGDKLMRATLYNEMSDFFIEGYLTLPERSDLIWNFTAARRDHYPPDGIEALTLPHDQPLGYYFNYQFTSTGSHVAQGEGPWKMEANFRTADSLNERGLYFSTVNAGNIREFVMELAANAAMMWDFETYESTRFVRHFSGQYFGRDNAQTVTDIYQSFYNAYWEQRAPTIPGFERQFIFHDLRYGRAMRDILSRLESGTSTNQPLFDLTFFNIDPSFNQSSSIRESIYRGTLGAIPKWQSVIDAAEALFPYIKVDGQQFFADNILMQSRFMLAINQTLNALSLAVSPSISQQTRFNEIGKAHEAFQRAWGALRQAEHGYFANWYPPPGQRDIFHLNNINIRLNRLLWVKIDDFKSAPSGQPLSQRTGWSVAGDEDSFTITHDPIDFSNRVLRISGDAISSSSWAWKELDHLLESGGTLFYRHLIQARVEAPSNRQTFRIGLNSPSKGSGSSWFDYNVRKEIDYNAHRASDERTLSTSILPYAWYNYWFVVDSADESLNVYRTQGNTIPDESNLVTSGSYRESADSFSILKLARSLTERDWEHYLDDFYIAPGLSLSIPDPVSQQYEQIEIPEVIDHTDTFSIGDFSLLFRVRAKSALAFQQAQPTVIYLKNLPIPRLGTDSDEAIIQDLLAENLVVITVDCSPLEDHILEIQPTMLSFFQNMQTLVPSTTQGALVPDPFFTYWLPEGYRLERDIPFWNIQQHGAYGSLERVLDTYNSQIVARFGLDPLESVEQLVGPAGNPLDYNMYLDLMYPSGNVSTPVPTIAHFATLSRRPSSFRSAERPMEPIGWLLDGYALAYVDHIYNPLARHENFGHFEPGYTLQNWNAISYGSAAIRFLRAHADEFNLSGRIGALGHSKSSYTVVRLTDPRHPEQAEHSSFSGFPSGSPEPQPWSGFSSEVNVGFASMGDGTRRTQYFTQGMNPIVLAVGRFDHFNHWEAFPPLIAACESEDINHLALWMEDMGHDRPFGLDLASGKDRNLLIRKFFAQHLYPHDHNDLKVLYALPQNDRGMVSSDGVTRVLTKDEDLPSNMHGLSTTSPISVRFAVSIDPDSIRPDSLSVWRSATGEPVTGNWTASFQNSRFQFTPDQPLAPGMVYTIHVGEELRCISGNSLKRPFNRIFQTAPQGVPPTDDFISAQLYIDSNGDGIPDWWWAELFESPPFPSADDVVPSGTNKTYRQFFIAGKDPSNLRTSFNARMISPQTAPTEIWLEWSSAPGRLYRIEVSENLVDWTLNTTVGATPPKNRLLIPPELIEAQTFFRIVHDRTDN